MSNDRPRRKPNPKRNRRPDASRPRRQGWDAVADWYEGWVGKDGSKHHRLLAVPAVMDLLQPRPGEHILDVGTGQGVLAAAVHEARAGFTGVDVSPKLLDYARQHHGDYARFIEADACKLHEADGLDAEMFDAVTFLLSIQDINPLEDALASAAWALKPGGRLVILMTHPCFRIPRQSGWGFDDNRKLKFRRIDRYLTPLDVPMKDYQGGSGKTISFHRPLSAYVAALATNGLLLDRLDELPSYKADKSEEEFPLFAAIRAWKVTVGS